jgi:hypothetical protein
LGQLRISQTTASLEEMRIKPVTLREEVVSMDFLY